MFRRAISAVAASAVVLGGLTFGAAPASAIETITVTPSAFTDPSVPMEVTINGFPTMVTGNYYVYWLDFANMTGSNSGTTCPTFTLESGGPATATPNGSPGSNSANPTLPPCAWVSGTKFRFVYSDATGLDATSRVKITFPPSSFGLPVSGQYEVVFTAGDSQQFPLDSVCLGNCPVGYTSIQPPQVTLEFNGNGGTCTPGSVTGPQGTWGTAPTADECTNGSRQLAFFSTSPTAALGATNVRPGGPIYFLEPNLLYAIWAPDRPSPVTDVVATPGLNSVKVTWKAPVSDGGDPINSYCIALRTEQNPNPFPRCSNAAQPLEFTFSLPATNTKYTPTVFARNSAGSSELVAGAPASPYDIKGVTASRKDLLLGLGGTQVEARGDAPGLAGQSLNVEYKVGAGQWTTQANAVSVDAKSNFRWSKKFPRSSNKNAVTVRFSYGTDAVVGPFVLTRGGEAGDLSAPRNIKVDNRPNKINVTWDRPKFDGGATITGYTLCATPGDGIGGRICRSETGTEGTFWNLNTRQTYTFTVSAKTTTREGPRGKYSKPVDPTDASIRSAARSFDELTADVRGAGFKKNSRFRVEVASTVPGVNPDRWDWDQVTSFREDQESFTRSLRIPLDASVRGERLMLRLITPEGTVYSRSIRP